MWKQNRVKILVTSLVTLLPCLIGLLLWQRLPELVPIHFNFNGVADDWAGRPFAVFALPGFFFVCHIICTLAILYDPKGENIGRKLISIILWIMPATSLVTNMSIYAYAMNMEINIAVISIWLVGILHIVLGNIMPKLKHNYTIGIKTSWTLADPENWYHTHRIAGWSMVIGGILLLTTAFWPNILFLLMVTVLSVGVPVVYSFVYYKRHDIGG